jgi:hypothetical protein
MVAKQNSLQKQNAKYILESDGGQSDEGRKSGNLNEVIQSEGNNTLTQAKGHSMG